MRTYTFPMTGRFEEPPSVPGPGLSGGQKLSVAAVAVGLLLLAAACFGAPLGATWIGPTLTFGLLIAGGIGWFRLAYRDTHPGVKHDGVFYGTVTARGAVGWGLGVLFTAFYIMLYWFPAYLEGAVRLVDPVARVFGGQAADRWFLYGFLYTVSMIIFGFRMLMKYRHNRYERIRTYSVVFFQLVFAFLIPHILKALNEPEYYFTYFWPLKYDYLFPGHVHAFLGDSAVLAKFMVAWGLLASFVAVPVLTYFLGKRWYCSWVCGCGGLAETAGDGFRQLSDKSSGSWKVERWLIHSVLVFIVVTTALLWLNDRNGGAILGSLSADFKKAYGFFIGAIFSGVVGVGFYPILGSRVWCRFGCPQAAVLGIIQRYFSRFRITVNGPQCMSCGNCSTYCEMGIDVRAYAQRGENIVRASCVGCGVCSAVCPRGVLKLENGATHADRFPGAARPFRAFLESLGLARRTRGRGPYRT